MDGSQHYYECLEQHLCEIEKKIEDILARLAHTELVPVNPIVEGIEPQPEPSIAEHLASTPTFSGSLRQEGETLRHQIDRLYPEKK